MKEGVIVLMLLGLLHCGQLMGQHHIDREYELKGAYIYHFMKYVKWKNEENVSKINIGIIGNSPIEKTLTKIVECKTIRNKSVNVLKYKDLSTFERIIAQQEQTKNSSNQCHLLFISKDIEINSPNLLKKLAQHNILILGEEDAFIEQGGVINFVVQRNKLKFEVNQQALMSSTGFRVSGKLLKLAILNNIEKDTNDELINKIEPINNKDALAVFLVEDTVFAKPMEWMQQNVWQYIAMINVKKVFGNFKRVWMA